MPVISSKNKLRKITIITLNRPERRNALTIELMNELHSGRSRFAADEAGTHSDSARSGRSVLHRPGLEGSGRDARRRMPPRRWWQERCIALSETRLITIAAVHGAAVAGGAGIMSACDFVVAAEGTKIGYPEVRRGLVAALVLTFLRRQVRERDPRAPLRWRTDRRETGPRDRPGQPRRAEGRGDKRSAEVCRARLARRDPPP